MNWKDVTVWQWQQIQVLSDKKYSIKDYDLILETVAILQHKTKQEILALDKNKINQIVKDIEFLNNSNPEIKAVSFIKVGKKKYKCNYDAKFSPAGRYIETKYFLNDIKANLHKIGASMILPMRPTWRGWKEDKYESKYHIDYAEDLLSAPFEQVFGSVMNWITNIKNLDSGFKGLFNSEGKGEVEDSRQVKNSFMNQFGWIYQASLISEHEKIKLEDVFELPAIQFLNDLSYISAKISYDNEQRKKISGNKYN